MLWTDDPADEAWLPLYERLKAMGYDGIELPLFDPQPERFASLARRLDDIGLERTAIDIRGVDDDPISADAAVRARALAATKRAIDCCEAAGSRMLGGPLYAAIGQFSGAGPSDEERARSVAVIQEAADHAAQADIQLSFEFLNRFEIYLLNCVEDTARYVADVGRPNVGIHYDTFHAHIEEKAPASAIRDHAAAIRHVPHLRERPQHSGPRPGRVGRHLRRARGCGL